MAERLGVVVTVRGSSCIAGGVNVAAEEQYVEGNFM
jgi:hypothetical protein